jgi:DNA-binding transcriptional ArsR family regulator
MRQLPDELLERIAHRFRAMSNPVRLKILHSLREGELSVSAILERVGGSQANASKHLTVLRTAGLVASRRDGASVYYRIGDEAVFSLCEVVCDSLHSRASAEVEAIEEGRKGILARGS